jgi:hypothetical protein
MYFTTPCGSICLEQLTERSPVRGNGLISTVYCTVYRTASSPWAYRSDDALHLHTYPKSILLVLKVETEVERRYFPHPHAHVLASVLDTP